MLLLLLLLKVGVLPGRQACITRRAVIIESMFRIGSVTRLLVL